MKKFKWGDEMILKIVAIAVGIIIVGGLAVIAPDLKRYMRMRSM